MLVALRRALQGGNLSRLTNISRLIPDEPHHNKVLVAVAMRCNIARYADFD